MGEARVYVPVGSESHWWLQGATKDDRLALITLGDWSRGSPLPKVRVDLIRSDETHAELHESSLLWLGSMALAMTEPVMETIRPIVRDDGEFAALPSDDGHFWMFVPYVKDLLDESRSRLSRFSDGDVMYVTRYDFQSSGLQGVNAFRIPQIPTGPMFCSERLVEALTIEHGIGFVEVWPDHKIGSLPDPKP